MASKADEHNGRAIKRRLKKKGQEKIKGGNKLQDRAQSQTNGDGCKPLTKKGDGLSLSLRNLTMKTNRAGMGESLRKGGENSGSDENAPTCCRL